QQRKGRQPRRNRTSSRVQQKETSAMSPRLPALAAVLALSACAPPMTFQGPMSAGYEVPPPPSPALGTVAGTVDPSTGAMTYTVDYRDLTGPATAAHFHGPAAVGANAPVVIPATVTPTPIKGGATLTPAQLADLQAGKYYFNIH